MSKEPRRQHSPEQKLAIFREHLVERKPVSDICEQRGIAPSLFYYWQVRDVGPPGLMQLWLAETLRGLCDPRSALLARPPWTGPPMSRPSLAAV